MVPHYQPLEVEHIPCSLSKMESISSVRDVIQANDYMGKIGISDGTNLGASLQVPQVCLERSVLPIQIPPIWPGHSTQNLHKAPTSSGHRDAEEQISSSDLHVPG